MHMPPGPDKYATMTALYADPSNIQGTTYGKRWLQHASLPDWSQLTEASPAPDPPRPARTIILAIHGGGIEKGTSELALGVAGFHPATLEPAGSDDLPLHDFWLFEGLMASGNGDLHVTASHYDDPIATRLVEASDRCISLHGCTDKQARGKIQLGGLDEALKELVLEELSAAGIAAENAEDGVLDGNLPDNIGNKTRGGAGGCAQLEMGTALRASLYGTDTRPQRKNTTTQEYWKLVAALRKAVSRAE
jgi:phage replication-related protein YjqB (UPF0714/DUF867 family)